MWALRFGLSHSGLSHGSVLDRASHSLGRDFSPSMESDEFVHILAYVRHPHHLVPSTWPLRAFGETAAFAAAVWRSGSETDQREHLAKAVAITTVLVAIMLCFFLGWFFVEVVPTRWAAAMYFYRLVIVFAWLGWVLVGASIAKQSALKNLRWAVLGMVSVFSAPALLLYQAALFASVNETARRSTLFFVAVTVLVVVTGFVFPGGGGLPNLFVVRGRRRASRGSGNRNLPQACPRLSGSDGSRTHPNRECPCPAPFRPPAETVRNTLVCHQPSTGAGSGRSQREAQRTPTGRLGVGSKISHRT